MQLVRTFVRGLALAAVGALIAACAGTPAATSPAPPTAGPTTAAAQAPSPSAAPSSPSAPATPSPSPTPVGQSVSLLFQPTLTYTAPAGWVQQEDSAGGVLLLPPGATPEGVDAGTSDYISVAASLAAESPDCNGQAAKGVPVTPAGIANWLAKRPALVTTKPKATAVGGLSGVVLDIRLAKGWTETPCGGGMKGATVIVGVAPSEFEHGMIPGLAMRLYLLDNAGAVLGVEVDDVSGGRHLDQYSKLIGSFAFAH